MPTLLGVSPFIIAAVFLGAVGVLLIIAGLSSLLRRRPLRFALRTLAGLLLLSLGGLAGAMAIGLNGYRAFTREEVAARIDVRPIGPQHFEATFVIPERQPITYQLKGDAIYVDAHILKWTPLANMLGLHTSYELDRAAGRYDDMAQERNAERTLYSLALIENKRVDLFNLRRSSAALSPLFDAEYGSGTFVPVTKPATFEVRVSTTGLLIREEPRAR